MSDHSLPDQSAPPPVGQPPASGAAPRPGSGAPTIAIIIFVGLLVRAPLMTRPGHLPDMGQFFLWGYVAAEYGANAAYEQYELDGQVRRWCNYPPLYVHVLRGLAKAYPVVTGRPFDEATMRALSRGEAVPGSGAAFALFKSPAVFADLATGALLFAWLRRRLSARTATAVGMLYVLHPLVIHNSTVWGQVDAIHTLFLLLSLEAAARRRLPTMTAWAALAILMKAQSILLAPIWLVAIAIGCRGSAAEAARRLAPCALVAVIIVGLVMTPFGFGSDSGAVAAYAKAVGFFPYVHLNGFSAWFLANPLPGVGESFAPYRPDDVGWLFGLTPRMVGMAAAGGAWLLATGVLWRRAADEAALRWAARLLPLAFFVLPTQIHERYLFPAVALWAWGYEPGCRWRLGWIVLGVCGLANAVWVYPGPVGGFLADALRTGFHRDSIGQSVGISCAVALLALLLATIAGAARAGRGVVQGNTLQ